MSDTPDITTNLLGKQTKLPDHPEEAELECVPAPVGAMYCVRFTCPEFTSLCPVTGQPDYAHITIDYIPEVLLVESKALKLFLGSFRNHGAFHEACSLQIAQRFQDACRPVWMRVVALWYPRGGIPIDFFWQSDTPPAGVFIPDIDYKHFRGR